jgi:valyl-tRNA synthetase
VEGEVEAVLAAIRGIRNARADAKIDPATWLPVDIAVPARLGATFTALQPAIERLTRARPLRRHLTPEALRAAAGDSGLAVVAGEIEAFVGRGGAAPEGQDRQRLEREFAQASTLLDGAQARLANDDFIRKAPPQVVEGARSRAAELADQVDRLTELLGRG